jgi:hypothetical protein
MQFSTHTLLKATAFVAICCGAIAFAAKCILGEFVKYGVGEGRSLLYMAITCLGYSTFWIPVVFASYWIGRKDLSWRVVIVFAIVQLLAAGAEPYLQRLGYYIYYGT